MAAFGFSSTARRHRLLVDGREAAVGFITTVPEPLCEGCDRARLDCRSGLYACLRMVHGADLLTPYRTGRDDVARTLIRAEFRAAPPPEF